MSWEAWTGGNDGFVKLWDVESGQKTSVLGREVLKHANINAIEVWPKEAIVVSGHSSGLTYMDTRTGKNVHQQLTTSPVYALRLLHEGHPFLFTGIGRNLTQLDTRMFTSGKDKKPKAVGQWTLRSSVTSINCTMSARGNLLVAAGCEDGKVVALDTES